MSTALLESSALQALRADVLHDSSETTYRVHGDRGCLVLQTCVDTNDGYASQSGGQIQDDNQQKGNSSEVPYKTWPLPLPRKKNKNETLHPSCLRSLASFKEIKVSILYTDRKALRFLSA